MDRIIVEGGHRLVGEVHVSGAKNAALPMLAALLLARGTHCLRNVPDLADVRTLCNLFEIMGAKAERGSGSRADAITLTIGDVLEPEAPYELVRTMRASVLVLGPLVARCGRARVSLPGGCAIGARPIDQHLKGLERLGATIVLEHGYVEARADQLIGGSFTFDVISVTGTENLMMAACLAKGRTVLENAACEPEIVALANLLNAMGGRVQGAGTPVITIEGVEAMHPVEFPIIPDRIEAGTFLVAAALTQGDILVKGALPEHLEALLQKLRDTGASITVEAGGVRCQGDDVILPTDVKTLPHPGFPTDMQAQLMVLLSVAKGSSMVTETVFENRFMHVLELSRMGADIRIDGKVALVKGVQHLSGAPVMATDLRASASLILAGLRARGQTEIRRVYHLDRGYERMEEKLRALGAHIERVKR
ncbi:MAG: UDP-N-acetylglucosamine 1-carboxyvinyltransferase [Myxococcales bacterium]|jgi:UDP-N-acetylglucosamine 1-carboxyvinyltransferase|nr:UDP-N-acetylglucosamine 1-carboxyvinyltransferase [Myxococcales bacterium]